MDVLTRTNEMAFAAFLITGIFAITFYYINRRSEEKSDNNINPLHPDSNWEI